MDVENDETDQELRRNITHLKKIEAQWRIHIEGEGQGDKTDTN